MGLHAIIIPQGRGNASWRSSEGDRKERAEMSNWEYCCLLFKMAGLRIQIVYKKSCVAVMKKLVWLMQEGYV